MTVVVLKVGGAVAALARAETDALLEAGNAVCIVHGAGSRISAEMARRGLEVEFVRGRRVTTAAALEVVRESLREVNTAICEALGPAAVGLMGDEVGLEAVRLAELGLVGDPVPSRPAAVVAAIREGRVPVVAPLARGPLNVNADEAAVALAAGIGAERLRFVTDVPGLMLDDRLVPRIDAEEADRLLVDGAQLSGGIVPKLQAAIRGARLGMRTEIGETLVVGAEEAR